MDKTGSLDPILDSGRRGNCGLTLGEQGVDDES